jgi:hypothetical protein
MVVGQQSKCEMKRQKKGWVVNVKNKVFFRFSFVFSTNFIISQMDLVDILAFQCPNFKKSCQFVLRIIVLPWQVWK